MSSSSTRSSASSCTSMDVDSVDYSYMNERVLRLPNRPSYLPDLLEVDQHPLVPARHGRIIIFVQTLDPNGMRKQFTETANALIPGVDADESSTGIPTLRPSNNDYLLLREEGATDPCMDKIASWSLCRADWTEEEIASAEKIRDRAIGANVTPDKAVYDKKTKQYVGGIAFERSERASNIKSSPRAYSLTQTYQTQNDVEAPALGTKVIFDAMEDEHTQIRSGLIKLTAKAAVKGLSKGPLGLLERLERQAELKNIPRVGNHNNPYFPAMQLNAASPIEESDSVSAPDLKSSLGKFGGNHADAPDTPPSVSSMTNLSKFSGDVKRGRFYIMDAGVSWDFEDFSTIYFCGLRFHGGNRPTYPKGVVVPSDNYRLTLIAYTPAPMLNGTGIVALGSLPSKAVLPLGPEMRNPPTPWVPGYHSATQSNYLSDGINIMEEASHFEHSVRSFQILIVYLLNQLPQHYLARLDTQIFASAFSFVQDSTRVAAQPWAAGPGWNGEDTRIGKQYSPSPTELPSEDLAKQHNSDKDTEAPYGNEEILEGNQAWTADTAEWSRTILLTAVDHQITGKPLRGKDATRLRGLINRARNDPKKFQDTAGKSKAKKSTRKKVVTFSASKKGEEIVKKKQYRFIGVVITTTPHLKFTAAPPTIAHQPDLADDDDAMDVDSVHRSLVDDEDEHVNVEGDENDRVGLGSGKFVGASQIAGGDTVIDIDGEPDVSHAPEVSTSEELQQEPSRSCVNPLSAAPGTTDDNDTMDVDSVHRCLVAEKHVYGDVDPAQLPYDEHEADGVGFKSGKSTGLVPAGIAVNQEQDPPYESEVFTAHELQEESSQNAVVADMFGTAYLTTLYRQAHSIAISTTDGNANLRDDSDTAFDTVCDMLREPGPSTSLGIISGIYDEMVLLEKEAGLSIHVYRQRILLTNMLLWERLDFETSSGYQAFSQGNFVGHWLSPLFRRCSLLITSGILSENLDAAHYLPGFIIGTNIFQYRQKSRAKYRAADGTTLEPLVKQIVRAWFGFPADRLLIQARFVRQLVDRVGSEALLLDTVWKASRGLKTLVLGRTSHSTLTENRMYEWGDQVLSAHTICSRESPDRKLLLSIGVLYHSVHPQNSHVTKLIEFLRPPRIAMTYPHVTEAMTQADSDFGDTTLVDSTYNPTSHFDSGVTARVDTNIDSTDPHIDPIAVVPTATAVSPAVLPAAPSSTFTLAMWLRQLELLYPMLDAPSDPTVIRSASDKLQKKQLQFLQHVRETADHKLPFRDLAPSRQHILKPNGPFSPANLRTQSGLFSALVFRGITFNAPFLFEQKRVFTNYTDYKETCDSLVASGKPESYFWNGSAYVRWTDRSCAAAEVYWKALEDDPAQFLDWLNQDELISFTDLFNKFRTGVVKAKTADKYNAFPHFGALTAYLMTVDYALAGCARMPSVDEMGKIVHQIGKGGRSGLINLGFECDTEDATAKAFSQAHRFLAVHIPETYKFKMNFSVFTTEHSLCKMKKLNLKKYLPLFVSQ